MHIDQTPTEDAATPKAEWAAPSVEELDFASTEFGERASNGMDFSTYRS